MPEPDESSVFSLHGLTESPMDEGKPLMPQPTAIAEPEPRAKLEPIAYHLPRQGVTAGVALRHAYRVVEGIISRNSPLTFKFGITHNVEWRWGNTMYGYKHAKEAWSHMLVIFESHEPYSTGMMEAALIERFESNPVALVFCFWFLCL